MMSAQPSPFRRVAPSFRHLTFPLVDGKFLCGKYVTLNKSRITLRFFFISWTCVPRPFPLHINLSHQWDPTDSCAIPCMLPLLQVLRTSSNKVTTITLVTELGCYTCQWSVARFCYIWHNTGYSKRGFAVLVSPCMERWIYELILAHDCLLYPS
jgi:hypothetical protein